MSDINTWPILNGNSIADHRKPPVAGVNRYAAFEDEEDCMFESTISDNFLDAEIDKLSKRQKSWRKAKKGDQRFNGNQMLGKPLRNSKISEGGMLIEKSKGCEIYERSTEHTQRVVFCGF